MTSRISAGRRLAALLGMAFLLATLFPATVAAHAELQRAIPADGETVTEPVTVITARYSEGVVGNSSLRILAADGSVVATGSPDPDDSRRMIARPDEPLTSGTFTVRSTAASTDGHVERTTWSFSVRVIPTKALPTTSPTASTAPSPTATPSPSLTASPLTPSPSPSPTPSDPTAGSGDVLLPILAALAIVAIGVGYLLRRGRPG